MKQSAPVMVNIRVRRVCEAHVMGIPERIDYVVSLVCVFLFALNIYENHHEHHEHLTKTTSFCFE